MEAVYKIVGATVLGIVLLAISALVGGVIVWSFWDNSVMPLFGIRDITFWEAVFLTWVCGALFKSTSTSSNKSE